MVDYEKRWNRITDHLDTRGMDAFVIAGPANVRYLCCSHVPLTPIVTSVVITRDGIVAGTTPTMEEFRAEKEATLQELRIFGPYADIPTTGKNNDEALTKLLADLGVRRYLGDTDLKIRDLTMERSEFVDEMRTVKDDDELKAIREAIEITRIGEDALPEIIIAGKREGDAASELDHLLRRNGAQCTSFPTIVAAGEHASYSHHDPSPRRIRTGESVIVDFGVYCNGYCSDITRTIITGPNTDMEDLWEIVSEAQRKAIQSVKPGIRFRDIDELARGIFREHGHARNFVHSTGHGMGLEVHENVTTGPPSVSLLSDNAAKAGNVFTIEPGLYFPGRGGIRIEDDILVTDDGYQVLTR